MDDLTDNAFLGGQLQLLQPRIGYRAGIDPVLLAAACPAKPGDRVLELGCGVGTALLCLGRRVSGLALTGVEVQTAYADLARQNARRNAIEAEIVTADLTALPAGMRDVQFDRVMFNPPYFDRVDSAPSPDKSREVGRGGLSPEGLAPWLDTALRRLADKGSLVIILRVEQLPDVMAYCHGRLGTLEVVPLAPRAARPARLVILRGIKSGRTPLALLPPIVLHRGATHVKDGDDYTDHIAAVLRNGAALLP